MYYIILRPVFSAQTKTGKFEGNRGLATVLFGSKQNMMLYNNISARNV